MTHPTISPTISGVKIALVHNQFTLRGGTERYLVGLACFLAERGHEVHVFSSKVDPVLSGIRGLKFHKIWLPRLGPVVKVLGMWLVTRLVVRGDEFDIVHGFGRTTGHQVHRLGGGCHARYLEGLIARTASKWKRFLLRFSPLHRLLLWIEKQQVTDRRSRLVLVSDMSRKDLTDRYGSAGAKLEVVHNGVDTQRFHPKNRPLFFTEVREQYHLVPEDTVVLFVGGDWERKGLDVAFGVVSRLSDIVDLKLLVAGEDRRFDQYTELAARMGVLENIHFAGSVERMERVYAGADLLLVPTRYDPFANVTLEALASEVPVVTSGAHVNGAVEVLGDCRAVRVVEDAEDVEGMAAAARELLEHPDQAGLRVAARELAMDNRDLANYERVEAVYREVTGRSAAGERR